jgi:hypothetical protein
VRRLALVAAAISSGCIFGVRGLPASGGAPNDLAAAPDLAGLVDLAVDAATPPPDLAPDPCASSTPLDGGVAVSACVIGNAPPVIDGVLDDWGWMPFTPVTFNAADAHVNTNSPRLGPWPAAPPVDANLSVAFALRWDLANLYVAVRVTDDIRGILSTAFADSDSIEIYISDNATPSGSGAGPNGYQLSFTEDNRLASYRDGMTVAIPGGTTIAHATVQGSGGSWTLEVRIPWTLIGAPSGTAGRIIGFDININDDDSGTQRDRWLVWKDAPLVAGGYSCMCPGNIDLCLPWCDARTWGRLVLAGR